jgi:hypothetical protein
MTSWLISDKLGIPKTVVLRILREDLKKRKQCTRFFPHALTREQLDERVASCQVLLNVIKSDKNFWTRLLQVMRVGVSPAIPKQSIRAPNGLANILTTEETALPKIKS